MSNRDLYRAITGLARTGDRPGRGLEEYLRALLALGAGVRDAPDLSAEEFLGLLATSFEAAPAPFDEGWRGQSAGDREATDDYEGWRMTIIDQVVDLREMGESGMLSDGMRYFGLDSPRGRRWYNFEPAGYLEGAAEGTFGGWEPGDDTGRGFVPGPVAVPREDGSIGPADPREVDRPVFAVDRVSWATFGDFLLAGRSYE